MPDLRVPLDPHFRDFGLAGTVTPLGGAPLAATVLWGAPLRDDPDQMDVGSVSDFRRQIMLRKTQVPTLVPGSTIVAPEVEGGALQTWRADRVNDYDPELLRVVVSPVTVP